MSGFIIQGNVPYNLVENIIGLKREPFKTGRAIN